MEEPTPLLSEVKLERFKAAFEPEPIRLQRFNVLIGRNGSGKSTLLEALQWIDTTLRRDAREACDRYFGVRDLINLRAGLLSQHFALTLTWTAQEPLRYRVQVEGSKGTPIITKEDLFTLGPSGEPREYLLMTRGPGERVAPGPGITVREPDRLALAVLGFGQIGTLATTLEEFWSRAVFLRLSPNRLTYGSLATRKSFEPLLDEEGQTLPALLNELTADQRVDLVHAIQEVLPGIQDVRGRGGVESFPISAWMLSEGTRRVTAILALLVREPAPSLLCIEEIENGLDPWTVREILRYLQSATDRGTQVILTTHSPWVLDGVSIDSILQVRRINGDTRYEHFASRPEVHAYDPSVPAGTRYVNETE